MLQRIVALVVAAAGILIALVIGFWTLFFLGLVAVGAIIAHALRGSRIRPRGRRRDVIEGEFTVVDDKKQGAGQARDDHSDYPSEPR